MTANVARVSPRVVTSVRALVRGNEASGAGVGLMAGRCVRAGAGHRHRAGQQAAVQGDRANSKEHGDKKRTEPNSHSHEIDDI